MDKSKKLYKSNDKMLDGVCAGIADYFGIDPTIVRVIYAIIALCSAVMPMVILYIALAIIMPREPLNNDGYQYNEYNNRNQ